jgi:hypothetical protein
MQNMEGYAARIPTMPCPGNHESHNNFSQVSLARPPPMNQRAPS